MKKRITYLLIIVLTSALFSGCSQPDVKAEIVPEYEPVESSEIDMLGTTFRFGTEWENEYNPELGFSSAGDKMRERYAETEKKFNIEFLIEYTYGSSPNEVIITAAAGLPTFDIIDIHGTAAYDIYKAGLLLDLDSISTIDLSNEEIFAPARFRQYGIYHGMSYGFYPWAWEFLPQFEGVLLFNNEHVIRAGLESPYALQERGEWSWANFKDYLQACRDSLSENGIVPMVRNGFDRLGQTAIMSNGVKTVESINGKLVFGYNSEPAFRALEYLNELHSSQLMIAGDQNNFAVNAGSVFMSCESFLGTLHTSTSVDLPSTNLNDYGMMPFPYGPNGSPDTCSAYVVYSRRLLWLPSASYNNAEDTGIIISFIFRPLDEANETNTWREYAHTAIFHHEEGYDNFIYMIDNINYDYSAQFRDISSYIGTALTNSIEGRSTPSAEFAAINDIVQGVIDKEITEIYN